MTIETFRKKPYDPTSDEEWCPKRKIKKLSVEPNYANIALSNATIVSKICENVIKEDSAMNHLDIRRVNRIFDVSCLHFVRKEFRHLQVISGETKEVDVEINDMQLKMKDVPALFQFLRNVAKVRIETIEFAGFLESNKIIHDSILSQLFTFTDMHVRSYKGADEICDTGCMMCYALASQSKIYGPMQWLTLHKGFPTNRNFSLLLMTEILLTEVAQFCVKNSVNHEEVICKMRDMIGSNVSCDVLELVVSDRLMYSPKSPTHPRNVIDCIIEQWKPQIVKIKFMTAFSSCDSSSWNSRNIFDELQFDAKIVKETVISHSNRLKWLEIDLMEADALAETLIKKSTITVDAKNDYPECSLEKLCSNVKRVFPSHRVFLTLPLALHDLAREQMDKFCEILISFVWNDEVISRNSISFVRVYCYGVNLDELRKIVKPIYIYNSRPIMTRIHNDPFARDIDSSFIKWDHNNCMRNFTPLSVVSLFDGINKCAIHLQICVENVYDM